MTDTVETARVVAPVTDGNPHGFIIINLSDVTDEHELFEERKPEPKEPEPRQKLTLPDAKA